MSAACTWKGGGMCEQSSHSAVLPIGKTNADSSYTYYSTHYYYSMRKETQENEKILYICI